MEMTVEGPNEGNFRWTITVDAPRDGVDLDHTVASALARAPDGTLQLWIREIDDEADAAALRAGFRPYRDLWQLRCSLPNKASGLVTRPFTEDDIHELVGVNNRAFHWHPEQGGLTADALRTTMAEPWFDADGLRLLHDTSEPDHPLVGFCWTKLHTDHDPPLGEIYVIAIDPSRHGRGLGKPMTLAGLEWLHAAGMKHGMLYVESDNDPANATYTALGFTRHHTDRAYRLDR